MDDLISRQEAIDTLAEDMPQPYTPDGSHPADEGIFMAQEIYADCIQTLKELPSAQMEIIGCKDCKHRPTIDLDGTSLVFPDGRCPCYCADDDYYSWMPDDDFYCKYGEMDEK